MRNSLQWLLVVPVWLAGCEASSPPPGSEPPVPTAPAMPATNSGGAAAGTKTTVLEAPVEKSFQGIKLTVPAGWEEKPPASDFIQGEYRISDPAGSIRVTMSSAGGGKEANIDRWRGQFQRGADDPEPQQETVLIDGEEAILVELFGTFRDGFGGGGEQRNWCMFGAVIPTGPANFFVKMTGPRDAVTNQRDAFRQLVTTAKLGD